MHRTVLLCITVVGLSGCVMAPEEVPEIRDESLGIRLQLPEGWTREPPLQVGGMMLMSPVVEAGWRTHVHIKEYRNAGLAGRSLEQIVADVVEGYGEIKGSISVKSKKPLSHPSGWAGVELLYTSASSDGISLTQKELILRPAGDLVLFATGSTVTSLWTKYEPQIDSVLTSIRPLATEGVAPP